MSLPTINAGEATPRPSATLTVPATLSRQTTASVDTLRDSGPNSFEMSSREPRSTLLGADEENHGRDTSPFSPFYNHRTTRTSLEAMKSESKHQINIYEDLEAGNGGKDLNASSVTIAMQRSKQDCAVWPGQKTLKQQHKQKKMQRGCRAWRTLSKTTKLWIKIIFALCIIGIGIGVGLGVSKAVGGGIWSTGD